MMDENENIQKVPKIKNPKRVAAGKKIAEAKKIKKELKRKEIETLENTKTGITKDDDDKQVDTLNKYKNYVPLCLIGVVGIGIYMYSSKQVVPKPEKELKTSKAPVSEAPVDPFEFN